MANFYCEIWNDKISPNQCYLKRHSSQYSTNQYCWRCPERIKYLQTIKTDFQPSTRQKSKPKTTQKTKPKIDQKEVTRHFEWLEMLWEAKRRSAKLNMDIQELDRALTFYELIEKYGFHTKYHRGPQRWPFAIEHYLDPNAPAVVINTPIQSVNLNKWRKIEVVLNLDHPKSEILSEVEAILDRVETEERKNKPTMIDPWAVYDWHKKQGLSFLKITRKLFKDAKHPTTDEKTDRYYKQVRRAYDRAKQIMAYVNQE
jgi:hypothetical protein